MYKLIKNNIERIVDNELACNRLICDGYKLLEEKQEENTDIELNQEDADIQDEEALDLTSLTLEELKTIAKEKGIEKYSSMKKAELIEKLG